MATTRSAKRLNSSEMFEYAFKIVAADVGGITGYSAGAITSIEGEDGCYAAKFSGYLTLNEKFHLKYSSSVNYSSPEAKEIAEKELFLLWPTADTDVITSHCAGAVALNKSLELVEKERKNSADKQQIFIIPLCEARPHRGGGFISWAASWLSWLSRGYISFEPKVRQHWTLLVIEGNHCNFYDPKGSSSVLSYSVDTVKVALESRHFSFSEHYVGLQKWSDSIHCGYFVGDIIKQKRGRFVTGQETKPKKMTIDDSLTAYHEFVGSHNAKYENFKLSRELRSTPARLRETFANVSDLRLPAPTSEFVTRDSINQADGKAPSAPCFLTEARRNIKTKKVTFSVASEREVETDYETPAVSRSYTSNKL